ncbi:hypothetical protein [Ornithinibacillus bavariensis]|uniref:Uncharacterized protein n=1 Tax=Ornithinibacillus bavariensis TaxID=545502 RepID=A0A919X843_9BACI|nr:hypothetical protein [Ornithinibacillus bavariensis]GIO27737.1 hypothetical protein J43TS3_23480 [Ornithinibacillus bavariensis]
MIDFTSDYKSKLNEVIDNLYENKSKMDRNQRMWLVQYYTDEYFRQVGERPDVSALNRLATLILDDEITNPDVYKMTHIEYPIMSQRQEARRNKTQVSIKWADEVGTDGKDYRQKSREMNRRKINIINEHLRDTDIHAQNMEKLRRYMEFTKVQPVITYNSRVI